MLYDYELAVLGLPVWIRARDVSSARRKLLARWLRVVTIERPGLPVCPSLVLLGSNDPRLPALDRRLEVAPRPPRVVAPVLSFPSKDPTSS